MSLFGGGSLFGGMERMLDMHGRMQESLREHAELAASVPQGVSYTKSSYSTSYSGRGGQHVEYSSSTRASQVAGSERVTETKRSYRDSTGFEKHGIARTVGDRGRNVVRTCDSQMRETAQDRLLNCSDGTAFDREWEAAASRAALTGGPRALSGGDRFESARPALSNEDRDLLRQGRETYERQTQRIIEEARRHRPSASGVAPPSSRGLPSRAPHRTPHFEASPPPPTSSTAHRRPPHLGAARAAGSRRGSSSNNLARQLAQAEADDFWC